MSTKPSSTAKVIVTDHTSQTAVLRAAPALRSACYVAFDILRRRYRPTIFAARRAPPAAAGIVPNGSPIVSEALSVEGRVCELFEPIREHDL